MSLHPHPAHTSLARMSACTCMLPDLLHVHEFELPVISREKIVHVIDLKTKKILHVPGPRCEGCG